jgi:hypothetical protein
MLLLFHPQAAAVKAEGLRGDARLRFRTYAKSRHHVPFISSRRLEIGRGLPSTGILTFPIPPRFRMPGRRYTVVNGTVVVVQSGTGQITDLMR